MTPEEFDSGGIRTMECAREAWDILREQYWMFFAITLVGMILQSLVPFSILTGPMFCGIFIAWFRLARGETVTLEMLFEGFDYFVESLLATLVYVGISIVAMGFTFGLSFVGMAFGSAFAQDDPETWAVIFFLSSSIFVLFVMTVTTVLMTLGFFVYPLIVDRKLRAIPAIMTSVRAVRANLGGVLGILGVTSLVMLAAVMLCIIPVFFVMPWCFATIGVAYRRVFPEIVPEAAS